MKSFFKTPERRKKQILIAGDIMGVSFCLLSSFLVQMVYRDSLTSFIQPIASLTWFPRIMALINIFFIFAGITLLFALIYMTIHYVLGLYEFELVFNKKKTLARLGTSVLCSIIIIAAFLHFISKRIFMPEIWAFHFSALFLVFLSWRYVFFKKLSSKEPYKIMIIGKDALSMKAIEFLSSSRLHRLFQFFTLPDDELLKNEFLRKGDEDHHYDLIVYPITNHLERDVLLSLVNKKFEGVSISNSLMFYKNVTGSLPVLNMSPQWLVDLSVSLSLNSRAQKRIKRILDISFSLGAIVLTLPLMAIIAFLIKITSRGPVLFVHERLGLHRKPFHFYKFRTMVDKAEKETGPVWAKKNDPRITPVGMLLRKTRMDELPQLFNVLIGDMSIVGPRPIREFFAEKLSREFPYYYLRFYVKPGLTGWAQVMGDYGDSIEGQLRKLEYELFYIHEYSLLMDAGIVFQTAQKVLWAEGQ